MSYQPSRDGWYNNVTLYGENKNGFLSYNIQLMDLAAAYDDVLESGDQDLIKYVKDVLVTIDRIDIFRTILLVLVGFLGFVLFCLCVSRMREMRAKHHTKGDKVFSCNRRMLRLLALYNFVPVGIMVLDFLVTRLDWTQQDAQLLWRIAGLGYLLTNVCIYGILLQRANIVLDNPVFASHVRIHQLKQFMRYGLYSFVFIFALPFYTVYNVYFPPIRNLVHLNPLAAIMFMGCDTVFSLTLLALFIYPFMVTLRATEKISAAETSINMSNSTNMLRKVVRKNLLLSGAMVLATFVTMVVSALSDSLSQGLPRIDNLGEQRYRLIIQMATTLDMGIKMVCVHNMSSFWVPRWLVLKYRARHL